MALKRNFVFDVAVLACFLLSNLIIFVISGHAEDPSFLVHKGNEFYREGKFDNAVKLYQEAIQGGYNNGHIYYNLGNSFYRLNKLGPAIFAYRKALLDLPRNADIIANLNLARKQVKDRIIIDNTVAIDRLLILANYFSRYELTIFSLILFVATCCAYILRRIHENSTTIGAFVISCLVLFIISGSLIFSRLGYDGKPKFVIPFIKSAHSPGVIVAPIANIHSGNADQYQVTFILHEGVEVDIGEIRGNWVQIILPTGQRGWIKADDIEILSP